MDAIIQFKYAGGRGNTTHTPDASLQLNYNLRSPLDKHQDLYKMYVHSAKNYVLYKITFYD